MLSKRQWLFDDKFPNTSDSSGDMGARLKIAESK